MHLHTQITTDIYDRQQALQAAKQQAKLINLWINQISTEDAKEALSRGGYNLNGMNMNMNGGAGGGTGRNRNRRGIVGPYLTVCWFKTTHVLRECAAVLNGLGDIDGECDS